MSILSGTGSPPPKSIPCARCNQPAEWQAWGVDCCTACHKAWLAAAKALPRDEAWGPRPEQRWVSADALARHAEAFLTKRRAA